MPLAKCYHGSVKLQKSKTKPWDLICYQNEKWIIAEKQPENNFTSCIIFRLASLATACILVHTVHYLDKSWHTFILSWPSCGKSRTDLKGRRCKQVQLALGGSRYLYCVLSYFSWNTHLRHASASITGAVIIITTMSCWAHASTCSQPSVNKTLFFFPTMVIIFTLPHIYLYFIAAVPIRSVTWH